MDTSTRRVEYQRGTFSFPVRNSFVFNFKSFFFFPTFFCVFGQKKMIGNSVLWYLCECVCNMEIYWLLSGAGDLGTWFIFRARQIWCLCWALPVEACNFDDIVEYLDLKIVSQRSRSEGSLKELILAQAQVPHTLRNWFTANIKCFSHNFLLFKLGLKERNFVSEMKMCASDK